VTVQGDLLRDRRRAFAAPGGTHDRVVRTLGALLPAGVGVVAAAMVVTPLFPRMEVSFLLDRNRVAITEERLKVTDAVYRGLDNRMRPFSVTAGNAVQHSAHEPVVAMERLVASLQLDQGPARLTSPKGEYDIRDDRMIAEGPVDFRGPSGYRMLTSGVTVDLKSRRAFGTGGVKGVIPSGTFSADAITADLAEQTVTLAGHARLRMVPGKLRMP
jgi:lipopolysaccharide export system protein LptC